MLLVYPVVLAVLLFCVGLYGVLARRGAILVIMSIELMLNAVNLNLIAFDVWLHDTVHAGQALALFIITVAAAEIGIGLAIVLLVHRNRGTTDLDELTEPADTAAPAEEAVCDLGSPDAAAATTNTADAAHGHGVSPRGQIA